MNTNLSNIHNWPELARQANWSVSKLAKLCGVSVRTLERHFLQTHGQMPKAWLAEQRQKQALELLCDGSSIKETCGTLGYLHTGQFSRDFKAYYGYCPTDRCNRCSLAGACLKNSGNHPGRQ